MKKANTGLLFHPVFIIALFVLLLNDFYWKYAFGNWLTGKLSDVAGLIVLPVFLLAVLVKLPRLIAVVLSALFFLWWKSPLSQSGIDFLSGVFGVQFHRTIDYTDLFAMAVSPGIFLLKPYKYSIPSMLQKPVLYLLYFSGFFALCATSPYRMLPYSRYEKDEVIFKEEYCQAQSSGDILKRLRDKGLTYVEETERYYSMSPGYQLYYRIPVNDSMSQWSPISFTPDSMVYVKEKLYSLNYVVASYEYDGEKFKNIRFTLQPEGGKKERSCISITSFQSVNIGYDTYPDRKTRKRLKKVFAGLFDMQQ